MLDIMEAGNKVEINNQLALLKENGIVKFDRVLAIPTAQRIPALLKLQDGRERVSAALSASLTSAMSNLNLRLAMTEEQIFELAEAIIDQSHEDNLGIEDVLLFLRDLITGKAGKIYDRMDIPTFFEFFENYRQQRHESLQTIIYEQHVQNKAMPVAERFSEMSRDEEKNAFHEALKKYTQEASKKENS